MAKFKYTGEPRLDDEGNEVAVDIFGGHSVKNGDAFEFDEETEQGAHFANKARKVPWAQEVKRGRPPKEANDSADESGDS